MVSIRRKNQIDANLDRIEDPYVRDALSNLLDYVNGMASSGMATSGEVFCSTLKFNGTPPMKTRLFSGVVKPDEGRTEKIPGQLLTYSGIYKYVTNRAASSPLIHAGPILDMQTAMTILFVMEDVLVPKLIYAVPEILPGETDIHLLNIHPSEEAQYNLMVTYTERGE